MNIEKSEKIYIYILLKLFKICDWKSCKKKNNENHVKKNFICKKHCVFGIFPIFLMFWNTVQHEY